MYEIDKRKFGSFVARKRKEKGYTQKELAQRLFISDKAVSKWETGASIPDTGLLIPLGEILEVSVTELLMCRCMDDKDMEAGKVEDIVKTAVSYSKDAKTLRGKSRVWPFLYGAAVIIGAFGIFVCSGLAEADYTVITAYILGAVFGVYFCFAARSKLPVYYDENRINGVFDGPFRMNMPGLSFNNSNWPHIVEAGRAWSCITAAFVPWMFAALYLIDGGIWKTAGRYIYLAVVLGGLFIPMYVLGKKYE